MIKNILRINGLLLIFAICLFSINGCNSEDEPAEEESADTAKPDPAASTLLKIDNAVFSIPSPIQTAFLIKKIGANFNKDILNNPNSATTYSTNFKKAINLGVYGADLGYVNIYEQTQDAFKYLTAVKKLADDLGVSSAFDKTLLQRFEKNMGNKDSLLSLVSDAYRASDAYLKSNERNDMGALILAGGWVESLYFVTATANKNNPELTNRISEQKSSLENLIKLLTPFYDQPEFTEFIDALIDLAYEFDGIQIKYTYVKPTVDPVNKMTTINSTSESVITPEQLTIISQKILSIRNQIIG